MLDPYGNPVNSTRGVLFVFLFVCGRWGGVVKVFLRYDGKHIEHQKATTMRAGASIYLKGLLCSTMVFVNSTRKIGTLLKRYESLRVLTVLTPFYS